MPECSKWFNKQPQFTVKSGSFQIVPEASSPKTYKHGPQSDKKPHTAPLSATQADFAPWLTLAFFLLVRTGFLQ